MTTSTYKLFPSTEVDENHVIKQPIEKSQVTPIEKSQGTEKNVTDDEELFTFYYVKEKLKILEQMPDATEDETYSIAVQRWNNLQNAKDVQPIVNPIYSNQNNGKRRMSFRDFTRKFFNTVKRDLLSTATKAEIHSEIRKRWGEYQEKLPVSQKEFKSEIQKEFKSEITEESCELPTLPTYVSPDVEYCMSHTLYNLAKRRDISDNDLVIMFKRLIALGAKPYFVGVDTGVYYNSLAALVSDDRRYLHTSKSLALLIELVTKMKN